MNEINGNIFGWHKSDCFFQLLTEQEVDLTQEQINEKFIAAWNRRAAE